VVRKTTSRGHTLARALALLIAGGLVLTGARSAGSAVPLTSGDSTTATTSAPAVPAWGGIEDSLFGRSGKLRAGLVREAIGDSTTPILARLFGDSAVMRPGVYAVRDTGWRQPFSFIALLPFSRKTGSRVGDYHVGFWPEERGRRRSTAYQNPEGFIEVTPDNQDTYVSEHFRLRDFLTKDQHAVWPKYLVLRLELIDKLELVIDELAHQGVTVEHMTVMSGFRTPQYNVRGVRKGGRARDSRHQYGDAADVFVDNDENGRMDDLNRDGRVDARDAAVIVAAVDRVDRRFPQLVGGGGVYRATRAHGPFAHVDVRGNRARWGRAG
jgi:peptidase M15-like protein